MDTFRITTKTTYSVEIKTSDKIKTSLSGVKFSIKLHSVQKETDWMELNPKKSQGSKNPFGPGEVGKFDVESYNIGKPAFIEIAKSTPKKPWYCEYIKLKNKLENWEATFPVYSVITDKKFIFTHRTCLPQDETNYLQKAEQPRMAELKSARKVYKWSQDRAACTGQPRQVQGKEHKDLPPDIQKEGYDDKETIKYLRAKFTDLMSHDLKMTSMEDFHGLRFYLEDKQVSNTFNTGWDKDSDFSKDILNSPKSLMFKLCKEIPEYFTLTDDDLKGVIEPNCKLADLIKEKKLFISDLSQVYGDGNQLEFVPLNDKKKYKQCKTLKKSEACEVSPAVCLMYVNSEDKFKPLAIQLKPGEKEYLFTADGSNSWHLAKMYYNNAAHGIYYYINNYLMTTATLETFQVGMLRTLSQAHPVYKLLRPYLSGAAASATITRKNILSEVAIMGGGHSVFPTTLVKQFYKNFNLQQLHIPKVMKKSGMHVNNIPKFIFGDFMVLYWKTIEGFVTSIICLFYEDDEGIAADQEIQAFANEMAIFGFGWEDGNFRGMPATFETRQQLIEICTIIIATSSIQSTALTYDQLQMSKFSPTNCSILRVPPPKSTEEVEVSRIISTLPTTIQQAAVISRAHTTEMSTEKKECLLDESKETWFNKKEAVKIVKEFKSDLKEIDGIFKKMKKFQHLRPANVYKGVAV